MTAGCLECGHTRFSAVVSAVQFCRLHELSNGALIFEGLDSGIDVQHSEDVHTCANCMTEHVIRDGELTLYHGGEIVK